MTYVIIDEAMSAIQLKSKGSSKRLLKHVNSKPSLSVSIQCK